MKEAVESEPEYPCEILPDTDYVLQIDVHFLKDAHVYVQRKTGQPLSKCCKNGNPDDVVTAAFGAVGLAGMSVNILGADFKPGHERWRQTGKGSTYWDATPVNIGEYSGCYTLGEETASVYVEISKVDGLSQTFPRSFENQAAFDKQRDLIVNGYNECFQKSRQYEMRAHCEFVHKPTFLNYWHGELHTVIESNPPEDLKKDQGAYRKSALRNIIEGIRELSTLRCPSPIPSVPENCYRTSKKVQP